MPEVLPFDSFALAFAGVAGEGAADEEDEESEPDGVDEAAALSPDPDLPVPLSPDGAAGTVDSLDLELPPDRLSVL